MALVPLPEPVAKAKIALHQSFVSNLLVSHDYTGLPISALSFTDCTFQNVIFTTAQLSSVVFTGCTFIGCLIQGVISSVTTFTSCIFNACSFNGSALTSNIFTTCNFNGCTLISTSLINSIFTTCPFVACDFTTSIWTELQLMNVDFKGCITVGITYKNIRQITNTTVG